MNGISALIQETQRDDLSLSLSPQPQHEDSEEVTICKPGKGLSPDTEPTGTLILDSPVFKSGARNVWFKPPSLWSSRYSSRNGLRQVGSEGSGRVVSGMQAATV